MQNKKGVNMKYDYNYVKKYFEDNEMHLVSTEYRNVRTELEYICLKHLDKGVMKIKFGNMLRRNSKCPYCMIEEGHPPQHLPLDIYKEKTEKLGLKFISVQNEKQTSTITFICPNHLDKGEQKTWWSSVLTGCNPCKYCNGYRDNEDFINDMKIINPNIKIIGKYQGARQRIEVECEKHNYKWFPFAYNLLSGFGCPYCGYEKTGLLHRTSQREKEEKLLQTHDNLEILEIPESSHGKAKCKCKICGKE